jgi:hypothetical protein
MHHKALWPLTRTANRGFRGYPIATVAFYGPDDRRVGFPDLVTFWLVDSSAAWDRFAPPLPENAIAATYRRLVESVN